MTPSVFVVVHPSVRVSRAAETATTVQLRKRLASKYRSERDGLGCSRGTSHPANASVPFFTRARPGLTLAPKREKNQQRDCEEENQSGNVNAGHCSSRPPIAVYAEPERFVDQYDPSDRSRCPTASNPTRSVAPPAPASDLVAGHGRPAPGRPRSRRAPAVLHRRLRQCCT